MTIQRLVAIRWIAVCATAIGGVAYAESVPPVGGDTFNAFLQRIAAECKPLVIGSDNMGEAITFNGLGAVPEHYNFFIARTEALYSGGISQKEYRDSLTAFVGAGSYNARSIDCIVAHLPATKQGQQSPPN